MNAAAPVNEDVVYSRIAWRQVPPGNARAITIENGFYKQPIVLGRGANMTLTSRKKILDPVPLIVPKGIAAHLSAPNQLTSHESRC